jgi:4-hydroxybenzoate polyprenyltransferase
LIRFHEYGPQVIITCLATALIASKELDIRLVELIIYATSGSISAFILNDIVDVDEDRVLSKFRNPLTSGELGVDTAVILYLLTATASITSLVSFNIYVITLALTTLSLSYLYSVGIRFKELVPMDLVVHGLVPTLLVLTTYITYRPLSLDLLILALIVFTSSLTVELLQEIRDLSVNSRSTVKYLGVKVSKDLILTLVLITSVLYILLTLSRYDLNYLVIYSPLTYLIVEPVIKFRGDYLSVEEVISKLRFRTTLLVTLALITYVVLNAGQYTIR